MSILSKITSYLAPAPNKGTDGRDQWPSRAAFLLASMGGCAGMGNLLRYPSQTFNNNGLQWFVPYLLAVFLITIPLLILEISIGQAYRGGSVVAYNSMHYRLKGLGLSPLYLSFVLTPYYIMILSWIMRYFRDSFVSPLPWTNDSQAYYDSVVANVAPVTNSGSEYLVYPGTKVLPEIVCWALFTFAIIFLSIFKGVGLTGRVVYFTMGLPIVITLVLIGRAASLPNAGRGIKLLWGTWNGDQLAKGTIWQTAFGQVFFSTGAGFGYYTSYASYNHKYSNAVMDAACVVASNVLFENIASFAVYGVLGFLDMKPQPGVRLGSFDIGFITLPTAVTQMPGANFWSVTLFFVLMVMGYSSGFAMVDAIVTMLMDAKRNWNRSRVVGIVVILLFLLTIPYCTQFGSYLMDGIDRWLSDVALVFVVWSECVMSTSLYRWRDVADQLGKPALITFNVGFFVAMIIGPAIAQTVSPAIGAAVAFAFFFVCLAISVYIAKSPTASTPKFWNHSCLPKVYFMAFYSGNQLRHDLNQIVGRGKNWNIPFFWAPLIRYLSAPVLAIIYSFAYPAFQDLTNDPFHILGFFVAHVSLVLVVLGFIVPRWYDILIPPPRREEGRLDLGAHVLPPTRPEIEQQDQMESASGQESDTYRKPQDPLDIVQAQSNDSSTNKA